MAQSDTIQQYQFNSPANLGIEVKPFDFLWEKAEKATQTHRADFYQLLWVSQGTLRLSLDFEDVRLCDEDALLISPGQVVRFDLGTLPQGFAVLFVPEFLGEATSDTPLLHQLLGASLRGYKVSALHGLPIAGLLHQLSAELKQPADSYQAIVSRSCLRILLAEVVRRLPSEASGGGELAERFFDAVEQHYQRLYSVQDYQQKLGVPEKPLAAAIRRAVGMTPKAYIDQRRLLEVKRLLAFSDRSIKEIAFTLGFDEPTNFNKFFRKHVGLAPQAFRQAQGAS